MMDKILTVRQPFASALIHGVKSVEYRNFRIPTGTKVWVHAGKDPAMAFEDVPGWLLSQGDTFTSRYLDWMLDTSSDSPRPDISKSPLSQAIYACKANRSQLSEFPFGVIIGWCVFGLSLRTDGEEAIFGRYANPVDSFHALQPEEWKIHKGSLGLMPFGGIYG